MKCPSCSKEITPDRMFCTWCDAYVPAPSIGECASVGRRLAATIADPFAYVAAYFGAPAILVAVLGENLGGLIAFLAIAALLVVNFRLFAAGQTLGKWIMREQVVDRRTGGNPGL